MHCDVAVVSSWCGLNAYTHCSLHNAPNQAQKKLLHVPPCDVVKWGEALHGEVDLAPLLVVTRCLVR